MARTKRTKVNDDPMPHAATSAIHVPTMTGPMAALFAKMLNVGCPLERAVHYCVPGIDKDLAKLTAQQWASDALVHAALTELNGGPWMDLPAETRYKLALDKHTAEVAFYIWAGNFNDIEHAEGLKNMEQTRNILKAALGQQPDESDPMAAFARFAISLTQNAAGDTAKASAAKKKAPQLESGLDKMLGPQTH